jgi:hypothetical protein
MVLQYDKFVINTDRLYEPLSKAYKTQTGYMSPYYLSKAYITNNETTS